MKPNYTNLAIGMIVGMLLMYGSNRINSKPEIELVETAPYNANFRYVLRLDNRIAGECFSYNRLSIIKPE